MKPVRRCAPARSLDGTGRRWTASGTLAGSVPSPGRENARAAILGRPVKIHRAHTAPNSRPSGAHPHGPVKIHPASNDNRAPPAGWASLENVR